jgi:hypothetical protein
LSKTSKRRKTAIDARTTRHVGYDVSQRCRKRIEEIFGCFPDMMGPAYLLFGKSGGGFAFGCVTGAIHGAAKGDAVEFTWSGSDEMEEACGDGWAELQPDGTLEGQICF